MVKPGLDCVAWPSSRPPPVTGSLHRPGSPAEPSGLPPPAFQSSDFTRVSVSNPELCLEARRGRYVKEVSLFRPQPRKTHGECPACLKRETTSSSRVLWAFNNQSFWTWLLFQTLKTLPEPQETCLWPEIGYFYL